MIKTFLQWWDETFGPFKCEKCGSKNIDYYDSRCRVILCQEKDCDWSKKIW